MRTARLCLNFSPAMLFNERRGNKRNNQNVLPATVESSRRIALNTGGVSTDLRV
jgi:hypothetical protein